MQFNLMQLNVIESSELQALGELAAEVRGEVRLSKHERLLYATDASLYQVEPLAVICPLDAEDVQRTVKACGRRNLPMLVRGGGTSLAGQCTSRAVVIDVSPKLREIVSVDVVNRLARVQAGATLDGINAHLREMGSGLFFAPDPATAAQATLGGCIGNNAAGARSIKYGRTSENIESIELVLADGTLCTVGSSSRNERARELGRRVASAIGPYAEVIRSRFPKTVRRNAGYALDLVVEQLDHGCAPEELNLSGLICGSEGTLALTTAATIRLHAAPKGRALGVLAFESVGTAIEHVQAINATGATAVELLDDVVLLAAAGNHDCRKMLELLPTLNGQRAPAVLYVEYEAAAELSELGAQMDRLSAVVGRDVPMIRYLDAPSLSQLWALRKAAEPLLHGLGGGPSGKRKPHTFVEDNAIPVENLGRFTDEFRRIVARHGTTAAYYAHASVGVLHVRPLIDLHDEKDRAALRSIAVEVADLARACGGVMSGEHGDGRVRGPLLERLYGPELMQAFRDIKAIFDPRNLLNPGNIVVAGPIESITTHLRMDEQNAPAEIEQVETYFDYKDQHGFASAVEMCNGAGVCRKTSGGTMCPSYRATLDERHATRGRANALRLAITGQFARHADFNDIETQRTLHLCLSCKACKSECPSNVDVARLKAEYTAQGFKQTGVPWRAWMLAHVRQLNAMGCVMPGVSNAMLRMRPIRWFVNRMTGIASERSLPGFAMPLHRWMKKMRRKERTKRVVLFEDCFTGYGESHIGIAALQILEALGYEVELARVGCCGRPAISMGLLPLAISQMDGAMRRLRPYLEDEGVDAFLFLEPSCLSAVVDDWLALRGTSSRDDRARLAKRSMLVEEFVERSWSEHPARTGIEKLTEPVLFHGHCHQKALWGDAGTAAALKRVCDAVTTLASGCCGMAGFFGFSADRFELSNRIGELSVFPPVREAASESAIVATGTSCRHQIRDATGRQVLHPIEILASAIRPPRQPPPQPSPGVPGEGDLS